MQIACLLLRALELLSNRGVVPGVRPVAHISERLFHVCNSIAAANAYSAAIRKKHSRKPCPQWLRLQGLFEAQMAKINALQAEVLELREPLALLLLLLHEAVVSVDKTGRMDDRNTWRTWCF